MLNISVRIVGLSTIGHHKLIHCPSCTLITQKESTSNSLTTLDLGSDLPRWNPEAKAVRELSPTSWRIKTSKITVCEIRE
jgi:hypothetical protein